MHAVIVRHVHVTAGWIGANGWGSILELLCNSLYHIHALNAPERSSEELRPYFGRPRHSANKLRQSSDFIGAQGSQTVVVLQIIKGNPEFSVPAILSFCIGVEMFTNKVPQCRPKVRFHAVIGVGNVGS